MGCCERKQAHLDELITYENEELKSNSINEKPEKELNINFKSAPRKKPEEEINKLHDILRNKLSSDPNNKIELEEMKLDEFEKEIEKNKKANEILLNNQNELNLIKYEGEDILFQSPPLKFQNKNNEIEYYSGTFDNKGNFCGIGTLITKDKNIYNGSFKNGLFDGKGIFVNENGNYYFGDWKNGKIEGKGKTILNNKILYEGDYINNEKNGFGKENYDDGSYYEGNFENNEKKGFGKYTFKDGSYYEGNFENNLYNGKGEFHWNDGRIYKGNFNNGLINGKGNFIWKDGSNYEGNYLNGIKQGQGVYSWTDGKKYIGNFINNEPHGNGLITIGDKQFNSKFRYGKFISNLDSQNSTNRTEN
jgi:hypothetical protein